MYIGYVHVRSLHHNNKNIPKEEIRESEREGEGGSGGRVEREREEKMRAREINQLLVYLGSLCMLQE